MIGARADAPRRAAVAVWRVSVRQEAPRYALHRARLDAADRERAQRFRHDDDRLRFVLARSTLREILARELGAEPRALEFRLTSYGKPVLAGAFARAGLEFNTSHSGSWILHGFSHGAPVGVDVEGLHAGMASLDDVQGVFCEEEIAALRSVEGVRREHALARNWVRKEAYLKARGEGLSRDPQKIFVGTRVQKVASVVYDRNADGPVSLWHLEDVDIDAAHVGCVAVEGARRLVDIRDYREGP